MIKNIKFIIFNNKIRKETFWAFVAKIISIFAGLFIIFFVPKYFGIENYGYLTLLISYISIFEILFGNSINPVIKRELSEYKFSEKGSEYFINGLKIKLLLFIIGFIFLYILLIFIKIPIIKNNFWIFLLLLFLMNYWGLVINCFEAAHRVFFTAVMYLLEYFFIIFLFLFSYLNKNFTLSNLFFIFIIGYFISLSYGITTLIYKLKINLISFYSSINLNIAKKFIKSTIYLSLTSASYVILTRIDSIMLGQMATIKEVGLYNIAVELTKNAAVVSTIFIIGSIPLFIKNNQTQLFKNIIKKIVIVNIIIFIAFYFLSDILVNLIYGPGFDKISILIKILGIYPFLISLQNFTSEILILKEEVKYLFKNGVYAVIFNIIINLFLIKLFGSLGAAIATISAYTFWFILNFIKVRKLI